MPSNFPVERLIYKDADILVVNKPSGLLTIPDGYDPTMPNLAAILSTDFGQVWMVHRLDKDTSGLVLFALNQDAHRELNCQFRERLVHKAYLALVAPAPSWEILEVDLPLQINAGRRHLTKVDFLRGKPAVTSFVKLETKLEICKLECQPKSGYRHQIRAHLYAQGIGILGDVLYQPIKQPNLPVVAPRLMLQAQNLQITHPSSGQSMSFSLPADPELESYWNSMSSLT